ncbi:MAG TPA: hypothetical protein VJT73_03080, partial [Polyangiaceae bacterium]|nr:hypothetical protein [Polyangiaceae bacterium]
VVLAACGGPRVADPASRFFAVHNVMRAIGLYPTGPVNQGSLAAGQEAKLPLALAATCVAVVAVGGPGVSDLALRLSDAEGQIVGEERAHDAEAVVRVCLERPGEYVAIIRMAEGSGEYVASSFTGGEGVVVDGGAAASAGGTCEAPLPLVPGRGLAGTTDGATDQQEGTCSSSGGGGERVFRLDLSARQRVAIDVAADFDALLYLRKGVCGDGDELACNDDSGPKHSKIDVVLDPGAYFVFVDGYGDESGSFRIQATTRDAPTVADVCKNARPLAAGSRVNGNLSGAFDNAHATCGRDAKGVDQPYRFDLPARARVRFVGRSGEFRPVVHVRRVCEDESTEVGCADAGFGDDEGAWVGVLDAGAYWVFIDSADEASPGAFDLSAETAPEFGSTLSRATPGDACGDALTLSGASGKVEGDTFVAKDDVAIGCAGGGAPDLVYRVDLVHRSRVTARLGADEASHSLSLERACADRSTELACGSIIDKIVAPGAYFLVVDGARPESLGRFSLSYKVRDMVDVDAACGRVATLAWNRSEVGSTAGGRDRFASTCASRGGGSGADRVYRFAVPRRMGVKVTLEARGFRGALSLRRVCSDDASEVKCAEAADDAGKIQLQAVLEPGTYFAVVDGAGPKAEGPFTLRVDGFEEPKRSR